MYPLNVILIGSIGTSLPVVRRELLNRSAHLEAEFADPGDAANALGQFHPEAREALPVLRHLLDDTEPAVRKAAAQALKRIDPRAAAEAGVP